MGFTHSSRLSVNSSAPGGCSFKNASSKMPARTIEITSSSPSGLTLRPKSGVPAQYSQKLPLSDEVSWIQTTVRAKIVPDVSATVRYLGYFFRTARDLQLCSFDDKTVGKESPSELATIMTVAYSLERNEIRLDPRPVDLVRYTCRLERLALQFNLDLAAVTAADSHLCTVFLVSKCSTRKKSDKLATSRLPDVNGVSR